LWRARWAATLPTVRCKASIDCRCCASGSRRSAPAAPSASIIRAKAGAARSCSGDTDSATLPAWTWVAEDGDCSGSAACVAPSFTRRPRNIAQDGDLARKTRQLSPRRPKRPLLAAHDKNQGRDGHRLNYVNSLPRLTPPGIDVHTQSIIRLPQRQSNPSCARITTPEDTHTPSP
jgi:hypothetical protein